MSFKFPCAGDVELSVNAVVLSHLFKEEAVTIILWQMALVINKPKLF
jgi:hypothetical protein